MACRPAGDRCARHRPPNRPVGVTLAAAVRFHLHAPHFVMEPNRARRMLGSMEKSAIVEVLEDIAVLLEVKGENPFKIRAYQNGARALEALEEDLGKVIAEDRLGSVRGIGKALVDKITTLHETGKLPYYEELRASVPQGLVAMLEIPGFGPKKVKRVYEELEIESVAELRRACEDGRVAGLSGFGARTAQNLLKGIDNLAAYSARHLWWDVRAVALPVLETLRGLPGVEAAEVAGSFRRGMETVGDLDFLVATDDHAPVMDAFTKLDGVDTVLAKGETKSSVRFDGGLQADLRVVPPARFASALHHFTGSKDHNVRMRQRALARGFSLSEWGLFPKREGEKPEDEIPSERESVPLRSEADIFEKLGLAYIPPELREGRDELELAEKGEIPRLVEFDDLRGVFHNHTTASDGKASLEAMARAARDLGWEYLGIADHSKASWQAHGLDEDRLARQVKEIRAWNRESGGDIHLFAGCEVDILKDGSLDFHADVLAQLDYVVLSVHASMTGMSREDMTLRIIRALEADIAPRKMLGHLTGRLLLRREGYAVDVAKIIDAAAANGAAIELNAHPRRLDMDWRHWARAAEKGVLCAVNPDAHHTAGLEHARAGVLAARKGGLTKEHLLNTRSLSAIQRWLNATP